MITPNLFPAWWRRLFAARWCLPLGIVVGMVISFLMGVK